MRKIISLYSLLPPVDYVWYIMCLCSLFLSYMSFVQWYVKNFMHFSGIEGGDKEKEIGGINGLRLITVYWKEFLFCTRILRMCLSVNGDTFRKKKKKKWFGSFTLIQKPRSRWQDVVGVRQDTREGGRRKLMWIEWTVNKKWMKPLWPPMKTWKKTGGLWDHTDFTLYFILVFVF